MKRELDIAAIAPGLSHLIEANAGTGKTYAIANLFLRFVLDGHQAGEILVVTFTEAATDELRQRIRARLAEALTHLQADADATSGDPWFDGLRSRFPAGEAREQACLRLELALLSINEAPIHTIHGFCQRMLSDLAFRGGQPFDQEQADDGHLREQALLDWWRRQTYEASPEALDHFLACTGGLNAFRSRLETLLEPHVPELVPTPLDEAGMNTLEQQLREIQKELAGLWEQHGRQATELLLTSKKLSRTQKNGQKPEDLQPRLEALAQHLAQRPDERLPEHLLEPVAVSRIEIKSSQRPCAEIERNPVFLAAQRLLEASRQYTRQQRLRYLLDARNAVLASMEAAKQRLGLLSFDDMITRLHQALTRGDAQAAALARELARRLPVVMVDEFQDTDPLQYDIFRAIHQAGETDHTLIMIGDPKQAIYGFRGGDIFAYLQAAEEADQRWSLSTNWRSSAAMIQAVNQVFSGANPFAFENIAYQPSRPPPADRQRPGLTGEQLPPAPLLVHRIPQPEVNGKARTPNKETAQQQVHASVAARIHWLLREARLRFQDRPLCEGDICVLVRGWHEADELRRVLRQRGIRAVSTGKSRLWDSDEALGLRWLLEAALLPDDRHLARQALAAPFLALGPEQIQPLIEDSRRWGRWVALLHQVHAQWRQRGFMSAFHTLLQGLDTALGGAADGAGWLARSELPERCLTNLLHLAELLQQASREQGDAERLLAWMREQTDQAADEESLLRLESDENLVKITTMHASKGLQYPVVMVPYLWYCRQQKDTDPLLWHARDESGTIRYRYRPWADEDELPQYLQDRERLSEDLRLAYVALTRAQAHCELWVGNAGKSAGRTALHWLLSGRQHDFSADLFHCAEIDAGLAAWNASPYIQVQSLDESHTAVTSTPHAAADDDTRDLVPAELSRSIATDWRVASFTAMTREVHQTTRVPPGQGHDFALSYPAGTRVGLFLHSLLERLDTSQPLRPQIETLVPRHALRHGLPAEQDLDGLAEWLGWILDTPLHADGLCLRHLDSRQALHELPFDFSTGPVDPRRLDALLRQHPPAGIDADSLPPLDFPRFQGMITGIIDLVFEYHGRYYLADYKSNLLGRRLEDYGTARLAAEIAARRYDLQYLLYSLALHRHLRSRLPDYDYRQHFGGVYYLFLRGMRPGQASPTGVWFHYPDPDLIHALDCEFFAHRPAEVPA